MGCDNFIRHKSAGGAALPSRAGPQSLLRLSITAGREGGVGGGGGGGVSFYLSLFHLKYIVVVKKTNKLQKSINKNQVSDLDTWFCWTRFPSQRSTHPSSPALLQSSASCGVSS